MADRKAVCAQKLLNQMTAEHSEAADSIAWNTMYIMGCARSIRAFG